MTVGLSPLSAESLIELLDQQCAIYRQLRDLAEQQSRLVADGDAEALLTLLNQRQSLIDDLLRINERIEPYKQRWADVWAQFGEEHRAKVRERMDTVQSMLDGIMTQDEEDRQALAAQRNRVGEQLGQVHRGSAVNRAYGRAAAPSVNTRFTDQQV